MPRFYDEAVLKKLQNTELEMLEDFLEIAEKHNIRYFAFGGTGLGSVRHQGFIPWDDDIDLAMPRNDYERLLKIYERDYSDKYYILNTEHYPNYPLPTTRLCKKGTRFAEPCFKDLDDVPFGIFLDLYAYDNLADGKFAYWLQTRTAWFWSKLLTMRLVRDPFLFQTGLTAKIVAWICAFGHDVLKALHVSPKWLYKNFKKASTRYNRKTTKRLGFPGDHDPDWNTMEWDQCFPCVKGQYERFTINLPKETDVMLNHFYGSDYMTLPPVNKRRTHFPYALDFGDGESYISDIDMKGNMME